MAPPEGVHGIYWRLFCWLEARAVAALLACCGLQAAAALLLVTLLPWRWLLPAWALAEACFLVAWRRKRAALEVIPERHEPEGHDGWVHFEKFRSSAHYNVKVLAVSELIKHWFADVPMSAIRRGNLAELMARGYYYKSLGELRAEGREHLVWEMLEAIEEVWGYRFEDGLNPELQYMHHLQEPLKVSYRPLAFYAACEAAAATKHAILLASGFKGHTYHQYSYYTYGLPTEDQAAHGANASANHLHPVVFLHGVGAGLLPYIPFLLKLTALGRPVLAVEYKHLSMRWTDFIPTAPEVAADMAAMFEHHGIHRASLVAHSFGTFFTSCLLKLQPDKVHSMCLIDPVCCACWSGSLVNNFVYSPARSTTGLVTWLIARDVHTAASISRGFFWTDVNQWPDEVPQRSLYVLSGRDDLVPVKEVQAMLQHDAPHARVMLQPQFAHADFLFSPAWQDAIIARIAELVQLPSSPASSAPSSPRACGSQALSSSPGVSSASGSALDSASDSDASCDSRDQRAAKQLAPTERSRRAPRAGAGLDQAAAAQQLQRRLQQQQQQLSGFHTRAAARRAAELRAAA